MGTTYLAETIVQNVCSVLKHLLYRLMRRIEIEQQQCSCSGILLFYEIASVFKAGCLSAPQRQSFLPDIPYLYFTWYQTSLAFFISSTTCPIFSLNFFVFWFINHHMIIAPSLTLSKSEHHSPSMTWILRSPTKYLHSLTLHFPWVWNISNL